MYSTQTAPNPTNKDGKEATMIKQSFVTGMRIKILEWGEVIDEALILRVGTGGYPPTNEIEIESLKLHPGRRAQFAFIRHHDPDKEGWRMLFEDPMAGGRCFSQRAPTYAFEQA